MGERPPGREKKGSQRYYDSFNSKFWLKSGFGGGPLGGCEGLAVFAKNALATASMLEGGIRSFTIFYFKFWLKMASRVARGS